MKRASAGRQALWAAAIFFSVAGTSAAKDAAFDKGWREDSLVSRLEYYNTWTRKTVRVEENDWCYKYDLSGEYDKEIAACTKDIGTEEFHSPSMGYGLADRYYNRGNAYYEKGAYVKAMADYDKAIELSPALLYAYNNRGLIHYRNGDYDQAIADYTKAIEVQEGIFTTRSFINRGDAYYMKGDYRKAIADYTTVIRLKPDTFLSNMHNSSSYRGDGNKARSAYRRAISGVYYKRGLAYRKSGELEKAAADQQKAIAIMRNNEKLPGLDAPEE